MANDQPAKKWYTSKLLFVNILALVAIIIQVATGHDDFSPELQVSVLAAINVLLRLITNKPLEW